MERAACRSMLSVAVAALLGACAAHQRTAFTPVPAEARAAVEALYRCIEIDDPELCHGVLDDAGKKIYDASTVKRLHHEMERYRILDARWAEPGSRSGVERGDVSISAQVTWRGYSPNVTWYLVRKEGLDWKIVEWSVHDEAEEPVDQFSIPRLE